MIDHLLTFEHDKSNDKLDIHSDVKGLKFLIGDLQKLLTQAEKKGTEHHHLMTEEWGGYQLSSDKQGKKATAFNHVKIFCWNDKK